MLHSNKWPRHVSGWQWRLISSIYYMSILSWLQLCSTSLHHGAPANGADSVLNTANSHDTAKRWTTCWLFKLLLRNDIYYFCSYFTGQSLSHGHAWALQVWHKALHHWGAPLGETLNKDEHKIYHSYLLACNLRFFFLKCSVPLFKNKINKISILRIVVKSKYDEY